MPEIVRRNPEDEQYIYVGTPTREISDVVLTRALEQIPTVNNVNTIYISFTAGYRNWPLFFRHLATRENLEKVCLNVGLSSFHARDEPWDEDIRSILEHIQQNNATRVVKFGDLRLSPTSVAKFLDDSTHLTDFTLEDDFTIVCPNDNDGAKDLAAALQRHPNLLHLDLRLAQNNTEAILLNALHTNMVLQKITIHPQFWSVETFRAFQKFMRLTTTLRELHIAPQNKWGKELFLDMAKNNSSLRSMSASLVNYRIFFNEADQRLLQSYCTRNERMQQFIVNPSTTIPNKHLYPETLGLVAQANPPSILFQTIRAASMELFAPTQLRTRKRKRPAYYKPS